MVLALFDLSFAKRQESLQARKRARYRLALASSFQLLRWKQQCAGSNTPAGARALTKQTFGELMGAMGFELQSLCEFAFDLIDVDRSGMIEMQEFEKLLFVCRCCKLLDHDQMLCYKVMVSKRVLEVQEVQALIAALPASHEFDAIRTEQLAVLAQREQQQVDAESRLSAYCSQLNDSLQIGGRVPLCRLDSIGMGLIIAHCWVMTYNPVNHSFVLGAGSFFCVLYCAEVGTRIVALRGLKMFNNDPRGSAYTIQNKVALWTSAIGVFGAVMLVFEECGAFSTGLDRLWQLLQVNFHVPAIE